MSYALFEDTLKNCLHREGYWCSWFGIQYLKSLYIICQLVHMLAKAKAFGNRPSLRPSKYYLT